MGIETVALIAIAAAGAAAQKAAQDKAIRAENKIANDNTEQAYRVVQDERVDSAKVASEQMSDRMLDAQRQLSNARVVAAAGLGSLESRATNIEAGVNTDIARANVNLGKTDAGLLSKQEAARFGNAGTIEALSARSQSARINFFGQVLSGTGQAAVSAYGSNSAKTNAKNYVPPKGS